MKEIELCNRIQEDLKLQGINISSTDICNLYISTLSSMYNMLDKGNVIEISDFGSFWRKEGERSSVTFFRPVEKLTDRINKK